MEYLSDKSLEELKHSKDWDTIQQETDSAILNEQTQGLLYQQSRDSNEDGKKNDLLADEPRRKQKHYNLQGMIQQCL